MIERVSEKKLPSVMFVFSPLFAWIVSFWLVANILDNSEIVESSILLRRMAKRRPNNKNDEAIKSKSLLSYHSLTHSLTRTHSH